MKTMKCLSSGVLVLAAAWVIPAHAQTHCSLRTLLGQYSAVIDGQILTGPLAGLDNGITSETYDGHGNFTSIDHVVLNGVQPAADWRNSSGTYEVNSDCTGKKIVTFLNNMPPPRITFFVITAGGKQLNYVSGNSGVALSGVAVRSSGSDDDH